MAETEAEFKTVLADLSDQGPLLESFKTEYETLLRALSKSMESETKLVKKTKELSADIASNVEKITRAKKEDEDLQHSKHRLQDEIERVWSSVDELHQRESAKRSKMAELKASTEQLRAQLDSGSGWSEDQERQMKQLRSRKEELQREFDTKTSNLQSVRQEVSVLGESVAEAENSNLALEQEIAALRETIAEKRAEAAQAEQRKARLDHELKTLKARVEANGRQLTEREEMIAGGVQDIANLEGKLKGAKAQMERYLRDYDALFQQTHRITDELDAQVRVNAFLDTELQRREEEVSIKRREVEEVRKEVVRVQKLRDHTTKRVGAVDAEKVQVDARREDLKSRTKSSVVGIDLERKEGEGLKKQLDDLLREREILTKSLVKAEEKTRRTLDLTKIYQNTKKNLENEINGYKADALKQRQLIEQLELDVERYDRDSTASNQKYYTALEEVKLQEMQIAELQKKIVEGETKLKQQQNLYEAVRSDRNLYSKNLIESQDEIAEMKRKFKIMNHQIEQLKEEITAKDHALVKEHFDHHKVEKEKEGLKNELTKIRKQIQSSEQITSNQDSEIQKLAHIISEADEERTRQQKEYDAVVSERDILGSQLIRRNEELSTLYEKIKIQQSALRKGEAQYRDRQTKIRGTRQELAKLQRDASQGSEQVGNLEELRHELFRLQRELLQEKTKVKALSEELERPLNVHRWRKLEGSDPQRFEKIRKIQNLQKRLIGKTEDVVEKDLLIQEKEKLYVELKNILARQPGPEVAEQLSVYQQNLKEKTRQMKAMVSELNMYQAQVNEYKYEIERLTSEMGVVKKRYFAKMRSARVGQPPVTGAADAAEDAPFDEEAHEAQWREFEAQQRAEEEEAAAAAAAFDTAERDVDESELEPQNDGPDDSELQEGKK